jgi:hypothetical protein
MPDESKLPHYARDILTNEVEEPAMAGIMGGETSPLPPCEVEIPIRHAMVIHSMALAIEEYRPRDRPLDLAEFDWAKFYLAVKEFL